MKTIYKILLVIAVFAVIGVASGYEATYTRKAVITDIQNDTVTCKDMQGHIWSYNGTGSIGQYVTLKMYDNHTNTITDDVIKGVK